MKEMTCKAEIGKLEAVTSFIDGLLEECGCPLKIQFQIDVAIDEIFSNIAYYAYPSGDGTATVRFDMNEETRVVSIAFLDRGTPFNPLAKEDPDVSLPASERQIGGLGIFMVKKTMDKVEYAYENGMNVLTIRKKI